MTPWRIPSVAVLGDPGQGQDLSNLMQVPSCLDRTAIQPVLSRYDMQKLQGHDIGLVIYNMSKITARMKVANLLDGYEPEPGQRIVLVGIHHSDIGARYSADVEPMLEGYRRHEISIQDRWQCQRLWAMVVGGHVSPLPATPPPSPREIAYKSPQSSQQALAQEPRRAVGREQGHVVSKLRRWIPTLTITRAHFGSRSLCLCCGRSDIHD